MGEIVKFEKPPVVETVLGVQFDQVEGLTNAHLGLFWKELGKDWPNVEDAPKLDVPKERFDEPGGWGGIRLRIGPQPAMARLRIRNRSGKRMVQVQNCRLDYNWVGGEGDEYPRYRTVRPEFDACLAKFVSFVKFVTGGKLVPNQWEVTYVNHLPKGTVWDKPADWSTRVFRGLPGPAFDKSGPKFEGLNGAWHFEIEPKRGRLHVEVRNGRLDRPEQREILLMKLTARGPLNDKKPLDQAVHECLELGHDIIVRSFRDLTSPEAHAYWNKEGRLT